MNALPQPSEKGQLIGYARVSTDDQDLTIQIEELQTAGCARIFEEKRSGKDAARPELQSCLNYLRGGDVFLVTRLDRLARSSVDLLRIMQDLDARGVKFRCIKQPEMNTDNANGRLILAIGAAFAEFELAIRKERQREGIDLAKARGVYQRAGRPNKFNHERAIEMIKQLRAEKWGATEIAERLKISVRTVYRLVPDGWGAMPSSLAARVRQKLPRKKKPKRRAHARKIVPENVLA